MDESVNPGSYSYPIGFKWGGPLRVAVLLGALGAIYWVLWRELQDALFALIALLMVSVAVLFSFVASSYSSQRRVFWDSAAWFQAACHGLVSPEGIYYRQFFRTRLIPWPAVFRLEYFPSESGKIEVHLFSRPLPLTFKTSSWSRYTVRELIETPPAVVRVLREHLGEKTFVIRTDKGSK